MIFVLCELFVFPLLTTDCGEVLCDNVWHGDGRYLTDILVYWSLCWILCGGCGVISGFNDEINDKPANIRVFQAYISKQAVMSVLSKDIIVWHNYT